MARRAVQILIFLVVVIKVVYVSGQQNACQASFVSAFYQCVSNRSMDRDNFLWLMRDGLQGVPPLDIQAFRERVCIEKNGLFLCIRTILNKVRLLQEAQCPQVQKNTISLLVREIFKNVSRQCEDACRLSFKQNLERCFTNRNFLSSNYLIFNITSPRDAIIGTNRTDVDRFCQSRSGILQCLKLEALRCADSKTVLRSFGLDLDSLDMTYWALCNFTNVYMDLVQCYRSVSPRIAQCRAILSSNMVMVDNQMMDMNLTEIQYRDQLCFQRTNQIQCEMTAITELNDTLRCNGVIVGLHTQQECSLLPQECRISHQNTIDLMCQSSSFHIPERQFYTSSASCFAPAFNICVYLFGLFQVLRFFHGN